MPLTLLARQFMMRRPSHRIGLPIPGAARFGRSRTLRRDNIAAIPRHSGDDSIQSAAMMIAQHPDERDSTADRPLQNIAALSDHRLGSRG
jgi:hypothetical protein